jgi:hypothetical protein
VMGAMMAGPRFHGEACLGEHADNTMTGLEVAGLVQYNTFWFEMSQRDTYLTLPIMFAQITKSRVNETFLFVGVQHGRQRPTTSSDRQGPAL